MFKNWNVYKKLYYGTLDDDPVLILRNDLKIKLRAKSTDFYALTNVWLIEEYNAKKLKINKNDTIIDIGAHIGLFSIYVSQYCKDGRIFSFEPVPENYDLLKHNVDLNQIKNIKCFQKAVTDKATQIKMYLNNDFAAHSIFNVSEKSICVESISLMEILDSYNIEKCDLLKLDCEGSEYMILDSLPVSYFNKIKKIVMEYHDYEKKQESLKNLLDKLELNNYKIELIKNDNDTGIIYAIRK